MPRVTKGLPHADRSGRVVVVHQNGGERRADHGAAAEAHDGHAGRHAAAIGKPLDQGRDRRDVAKPETDAADDAGPEPHQPKLVDIDADRRNHQTAAPAQRRDDAGPARSDALEPTAPDGGRDPEQDEEQRIHPAEIELGPIAVGGEQRVRRYGDLAEEGGRVAGTRDGLVETLSRADGAPERQPKHAEAVGHADAEMDGERGRRHEPAVIVRRRNNPGLVEQAGMIACLGSNR